MQTVAETALFTKQAEKLFSPDEKSSVIDLLASDPSVGDEIPGTGGVRKVRVAAGGKGKRGGARVIYYWYSEAAPIYALMVYGKSAKTDLTPQDAKIVSEFAAATKALERRRRR